LADYDFVTDSGILSQILDDNSIPFKSECIAAIKSTFLETFRSYIHSHGAFPEIPGAKDLLKTLLASQCHCVAIATGGWREIATLKLESAGFDLAQLPLATSDDSFDRTEIMRIALSKLGNGFESVSYYGDGPWDKHACDILGWQFVAVGPLLSGIESYVGVRVA
jgi:hypothetical protein